MNNGQSDIYKNYVLFNYYYTTLILYKNNLVTTQHLLKHAYFETLCLFLNTKLQLKQRQRDLYSRIIMIRLKFKVIPKKVKSMIALLLKAIIPNLV